MRIKLEFLSNSERVFLKPGYNSILQGFFYNYMDKKRVAWLHDEGFVNNKGRKFKLFNFSGILERAKYNKKENVLEFPTKISFVFASPVDWIIESIAYNMAKQENFRLGSNNLFLSSISMVKNYPIRSESVKIKALSPIEAHSTVEKQDGKKLTHYYSPFESEFETILADNLASKWNAFFKNDMPDNFHITPLFSGNKYEKPLNIKHTFVKGWMGYYRMEAPIEVLKFALDVGLGGKNSMGLGMIEVARRNDA